MRQRIGALGLGLLIGTGGCASVQRRPAEPTETSAEPRITSQPNRFPTAGPQTNQPPAATLAVVDEPDGVALEFTARHDAAAVRKQVVQLAERHNDARYLQGRRDLGARSGLGLRLPEARATVETIPNGARLYFHVDQPQLVPVLRSRARELAEQLQRQQHPIAIDVPQPPVTPPSAPGGEPNRRY